MDVDHIHAMTRRTFLGGAGATAAAVVFPSVSSAGIAAAADAVDPGDGYWLGTDLWGNRLQDWVRHGGRLECVAPGGQRRTRTVTWLTKQIDGAPFTLRVRTGTLTAGAGFSGFLIGTGVVGEDWRRRVLVGSASGVGGGLMAVYEADGRVRFREHTDESAQFAFAERPATIRGSGPTRAVEEDLTLELVGTPRPGGTVTLLLRVLDTASGRELTVGTLDKVGVDEVRGGVGLVASTLAGSGSLYWFADLDGSGSGLSTHPERILGPVVGTLFSVNGSVLKLTAQLMPVNTATYPRVTLQIADGRSWRPIATEPVGPGYTAVFRVTDWDPARACQYRVVLADGSSYEGTIPAEPDEGLTIATINCIKASHRPIDRTSEHLPRLAGSQPLDLYSEPNLYFPHDTLAGNLAAHGPDLLVAHGDQLYEGTPTVKDGALAPELDWLSKYLLWLWSFRDLTRDIPTIVLVDDHDVYQGNIWGEGGVPAPDRDINAGGYANSAEWVNVVQRVSCAHNPDPYDPTPVEQGIEVYYGAFSYGGVSFAIIEDRKFKTGRDGLGPDGQPLPDDELVLLGDRQEAFLAAWRDQHPGQPKVVLTQTAWACVQTSVTGTANADRDSNGWPKPARDRALRLVRDAGALLLSGDQHLGSLIRHGIADLTDGPIQFTAPGGSTSWQRWFQPASPLPNPGGTDHTGDWTDGFGNHFRVLAVVNPSFTQADYRAAYPGTGNDFGDRTLKNEGYGIVRVDPAQHHIILECWRWDTPVPGGSQYPGFPVTVPYEHL
jgi:alkaline phosphatase D